MAATPRLIRRVAFQTLFQLDARGGTDVDPIRGSLENVEELSDTDRRKAFEFAQAAYQAKAQADRDIVALTPAWPTHRQPAVDRNILRLAHYEITQRGTAAGIVINEAVELAKSFGTERSPAFVNGVLDRIARSRASANANAAGAVKAEGGTSAGPIAGVGIASPSNATGTVDSGPGGAAASPGE